MSKTLLLLCLCVHPGAAAPKEISFDGNIGDREGAATPERFAGNVGDREGHPHRLSGEATSKEISFDGNVGDREVYPLRQSQTYQKTVSDKPLFREAKKIEVAEHEDDLADEASDGAVHRYAEDDLVDLEDEDDLAEDEDDLAELSSSRRNGTDGIGSGQNDNGDSNQGISLLNSGGKTRGKMGKGHSRRRCRHGWQDMGEMNCLPYAPTAFSTYDANHQFRIGPFPIQHDTQCSDLALATMGVCYYVFHEFGGAHHMFNNGGIGNCELFTRCYPSGSWDGTHACRAPFSPMKMQCSAYQGYQQFNPMMR